MIRPHVVLCCLIWLSAGASASETNEADAILLRENWFIQSSANQQAEGAAISTVGFHSNDWYPATIPATVLSALVEDKVYPDPYSGMNLRSIPGTSYPIFEDFSNIMLDVALRGIGDRWNDVVIPGFDFCVVENTLGKYGTRVETLTKLPIHAQSLVGV